MAEVLEVVARFGDAIIDVARITSDGRGGRAAYRIGSAPGVDLPAYGLTSFPLVAAGATGLVVRTPHGFRAREADGVTEIVLGLVTVTITPITCEVARVPLRPIERRFWAYAAPILALHLGVWGAAHRFGPPLERLRAEPARPRLVHVAHVEQPDPPKPPPLAIKVAASAPQAESGPVRKAPPRDRRGGKLLGEGAGGVNLGGAISTMLGHVDFEQVTDATPYDEQGAKDREFGGGSHFDPCKRFDCHATEKLKRFETITDGAGVGGTYLLPAGDHAFHEVRPAQIAICPSEQCRAHGDIDELAIRREVGKLHAAVARCYEKGPQQVGKVRIDLEIDRSGAVAILGAKGLGDTAVCVGDLVRGIAFASHDIATRARIVIEMAPPVT